MLPTTRIVLTNHARIRLKERFNQSPSWLKNQIRYKSERIGKNTHKLINEQWKELRGKEYKRDGVYFHIPNHRMLCVLTIKPGICKVITLCKY